MTNKTLLALTLFLPLTIATSAWGMESKSEPAPTILVRAARPGEYKITTPKAVFFIGALNSAARASNPRPTASSPASSGQRMYRLDEFQEPEPARDTNDVTQQIGAAFRVPGTETVIAALMQQSIPDRLSTIPKASYAILECDGIIKFYSFDGIFLKKVQLSRRISNDYEEHDRLLNIARLALDPAAPKPQPTTYEFVCDSSTRDTVLIKDQHGNILWQNDCRGNKKSKRFTNYTGTDHRFFYDHAEQIPTYEIQLQDVLLRSDNLFSLDLTHAHEKTEICSSDICPVCEKPLQETDPKKCGSVFLPYGPDYIPYPIFYDPLDPLAPLFRNYPAARNYYAHPECARNINLKVRTDDILVAKATIGFATLAAGLAALSVKLFSMSLTSDSDSATVTMAGATALSGAAAFFSSIPAVIGMGLTSHSLYKRAEASLNKTRFLPYML